MLNTVLKGLFFRIYLSKYFSRLQSINELYSQGNKDEYLRKMDIFFSDLLRFPQVYNNTSQNIQIDNNELIKSFSETPDDPIHSIYSSHTELLLKTKTATNNRRANDLIDLSGDIDLLLDKLYNAALHKKRRPNRIKYLIVIAGVVSIFLLSFILYSPLKERYFEEKTKYDVVASEEARKEITIKDIFELKVALERYHSENKSYPKSSGGWDAIIAAFGESKKDWIPGLVPRYIKALPTDPRQSKDPMWQYMYKSDGKDFKLIAHFPLGMNEIISDRPELIDSVRSSWAFGVWSKGAKSW
ncbi:MAG TPA: type II secretion system protein GspG [Flavitalea sp.]|nr:type II secretion system protein GspG [Flavitalea sp.]